MYIPKCAQVLSDVGLGSNSIVSPDHNIFSAIIVSPPHLECHIIESLSLSIRNGLVCGKG